MAAPIFNEKALILGDALVVADLHIGIEHELRDRGIFVRSNTDDMKRKAVKLLRRSGAARLIILGDLKHSIPLRKPHGSAHAISYGERSEIKNFVEELSSYAEVILIKGNHDGSLERMFPDTEIHKSYSIDNVLLVHGHADIGSKPEPRKIIIGHNHPCIEFVDDFGKGVRESAWIKARLNKRAAEFYGMKNAPELIVMPAFNDRISGTPFNTKGQLLGPLFKRGFVDMENACAYLLDGTLLGKIKDLRTPDKKCH